MRIFCILLVFLFAVSVANADLFQTNNPFPNQLNPESFNNIYETEPSVINKEMRQKKKLLWKINNNDDDSQTDNASGFTTPKNNDKTNNFYFISD